MNATRVATRIMALLFVVSTMLHGQESAGPLSQAEEGRAAKYPAFTWDRIPRYMHIRKSTSFTEKEIAFLARFPLITFEKSTGHKDHGSVEEGTLIAARAVKKLNPGARILYYRNVIIHYGGYAADKALEQVPGAFLASKAGSTKLVRDRLPAYDLSSPTVREWWVESARKVLADPAIDGLFLDGNIKMLEAGYLAGQIGAEKKKATMEGYHLMMRQVREVIGPDKLMVANILRARFPQAGLEYMHYFDGSYLEGFFQKVGTASYEEYVAKGIEAVQKAARDGRIIAFTATLSDAENTSEMGIDEAHGRAASEEEAREALAYNLAVFLICAERYSYFLANEGYSAEEGDRWMRCFPEYDKPLGPPKGPAERNGFVYTRSFEHADVWLDIHLRKGRITWK